MFYVSIFLNNSCYPAFLPITRFFHEAADPDQEALWQSGYTFKLEFKPPPQQPPCKKRKRRRNVVWSNPPNNKHVKTNIRLAFISLIERSFPTGHKLTISFIRNTIKFGYSWMPNVNQIIDGPNKPILKIAETAQPQKDGGKTCSCRKIEDCPLNGECLVSEVVYQATVTTRNKKERYIGLTATQFKARYRNHLMSFRHGQRRDETELNKHLPQITWKILAKAKPFTNFTKRCNPCTMEKFFLICRPHMVTLNRRNELASTCRHRRKFILRYNWTCQSQRF